MARDALIGVDLLDMVGVKLLVRAIGGILIACQSKACSILRQGSLLGVLCPVSTFSAIVKQVCK